MGGDFKNKLKPWQYSALFLLARFVLVISIPLDGLRSYGDFWNFYALASQGVPFFDLWVEFPPLFPFISRCMYILAAGKEHSYLYLGVLLFSLIQAGNIYFFQNICRRLYPEGEAEKRTLLYIFMLVSLFYGWAYFDCLAVFCLLLGLDSYLKGKHAQAGLVLGLGGLVKWFPVLLLPAFWKKSGAGVGAKISSLALGIIGSVWLALGLVSPEFTKASLVSQGAKGSWETIWAVIDGNLTTGNFSSAVNRMDPASAVLQAGSEAAIPPWITLIVFAGLGLFVLLKSRLDDEKILVALIALTMIVFFLWSPGYSPQWVLFLIPLVLLSLDRARAVLLSLTLLLVNLLEWPLILSRGWFIYLEEIVILRTAVMLLLAAVLAQILLKSSRLEPGGRLEKS